MIQDELIEKLARKLCETDRHDDTPWEQCSSWWKLEYLQQAKQILAIIKEAGYVEADKIVVNDIEELIAKDGLDKWAKANGYVKLAETQELPPLEWVNYLKPEIKRDLLLAGWRKIKLEE